MKIKLLLVFIVFSVSARLQASHSDALDSASTKSAEIKKPVESLQYGRDGKKRRPIFKTSACAALALSLLPLFPNYQGKHLKINTASAWQVPLRGIDWLYNYEEKLELRDFYFRYLALRDYAAGNVRILNEDLAANPANPSFLTVIESPLMRRRAEKFRARMNTREAQQKLLNALLADSAHFEIRPLQITDRDFPAKTKNLRVIYVSAHILDTFGFSTAADAKIPLVLFRPYLKLMTPEAYLLNISGSTIPNDLETPASDLFAAIHRRPPSPERNQLEEAFIKDMDAVLKQENAFMQEKNPSKFSAEHFVALLDAKIRLLPGSTQGSLGYRSTFSFSSSIIAGGDWENNGLIDAIDPWSFQVFAKAYPDEASHWVLKNGKIIELSMPAIDWKDFRDHLTPEAKAAHPDLLNIRSLP